MKQNKKRNDIKVVGITGGVGSGKSVVMNILKEKYGAEIILADLVAHDLMEPGQKKLFRYCRGIWRESSCQR